MIAWRFTDRETQDIVRPAILEHLEQLEETLQTIESMQEA